MADLNNGGKARKRKRSVVLPLILILLGILLLLNNVGLVTWSVWEVIAKLWPLILIALGLELILGRGSVWASGLIIIVVVIGGFGLFMLPPRGGWGPAVSERIYHPLSGATSADVDIRMGVGSLYLNSLPNSQDLVSGTVSLMEGEWLAQDFNVVGNKARLVLEAKGRYSFNFPGIRSRTAEKWDLRLNESIPMNLDIHTGVGEARIDLERIFATNAEVRTGVGKTDLTLPAKGHTRVTLSGGVGETHIYVPKGVAARIRTKTGIGSVQVYGNYTRVNDEYISPDFDTAENRVELEVKGGVGSIRIQGQ